MVSACQVLVLLTAFLLTNAIPILPPDTASVSRVGGVELRLDLQSSSQFRFAEVPASTSSSTAQATPEATSAISQPAQTSSSSIPEPTPPATQAALPLPPAPTNAAVITAGLITASQALASSCFKWISDPPGNVTDMRADVFSWVDQSGIVNIIGGCSSSTKKNCATVVQYLAESKNFQSSSLTVSDATQVVVSGAAYAHDAATDYVYDFGGSRPQPSGGATLVNWLGQYQPMPNGFLWNLVSVSGTLPAPLQDASLSVVNDMLVLFGGYNQNGWSNNVYSMPTSGPQFGAWTLQRCTGQVPSPRSGHSSSKNGGQGAVKLTIFGGTDGTNMFNDVYVLDTSSWTWTLVVPVAAVPALQPSARLSHNAVHMPGNLLFIFGGFDMMKSQTFSDMFVLDMNLNVWLSLPPSVSSGVAQVGAKKAAAVHYIIKSRMEIFSFGGAFLDQTSTLSYNIFQPRRFDLNAVCPSSCQHGSTFGTDPLSPSTSVCACPDGYNGKFCQFASQCPNNCTSPINGLCFNGLCSCSLGFGSIDCSIPKCSNNCGGPLRGSCSGSYCHCNLGVWGLDCQQNNCPLNCNGFGICQSSNSVTNINTCKCLPGFSGDGCQYWANNTNFQSFIEIAQESFDSDLQVVEPMFLETMVQMPIYVADYSCLNNCSGHGYCKKSLDFSGRVTGRCECVPGFAGTDCSGECPLHCSGISHGTCFGDDPAAVSCQCRQGFTGLGCFQQFCFNNCSGHGVCLNNQCLCRPPYSGAGCELDTSCSNNGLFINGKCSCFYGFGGRFCDQPVTCGSVCQNGGVCIGASVNGSTSPSVGVCKCSDGWAGASCTERTCPRGCNGNGICHPGDGTCSCYSGYTGNDCSVMLLCPANCTGTQGYCNADVSRPGTSAGICKCAPKWNGADCSRPGCPNDCNNRGNCVAGMCMCQPGYSGDACEIMCPDLCVGNGICVGGTCKCYPGFSSPNCNSTGVCPGFGSPAGECSGQGECFRPNQQCFCQPGFTGPDCSQQNQCGVSGCGLHGRCANSRCYCDLGFEGTNCEKKSACAGDCSGHGFCNNAKCFCYTGFSGAACETMVSDSSCPNNCNGMGVCRYGLCFCADGQTGLDCSQPVTPLSCQQSDASLVCQGRGTCRFSKCYCDPGYQGQFCENQESCFNGCVQGQGACLGQQCHCLPGFKGVDCSQQLVCEGSPLPCSGNGVCIQGTCSCLPGFGGSSCLTPLSPPATSCINNCSGFGVCASGKCFCVAGRTGLDCSIHVQSACPLDCSGNGHCAYGKCWCKPGYTGNACENQLSCSVKCLDNGICAYGKCVCLDGWTGPDCDTPSNSVDIVNSLKVDLQYSSTLSLSTAVNKKAGDYCVGGCGPFGVCYNNMCQCPEPSYGPNCKHMRLGTKASRCGNACNGNGACLLNRCVCKPSYTGHFCETPIVFPCPGNCSGVGNCFMGRCICPPGSIGVDCSRQDQCFGGCGKGVCFNGGCTCATGWTGAFCNVSTAGSAAVANMQFRETSDSSVSFSSVIGLSECDTPCGLNGLCLNKVCYCKPGFSGQDCSTPDIVHVTPQVLPSPAIVTASISKPIALVPEAKPTELATVALSFAGGVLLVVLFQYLWARRSEMQRQQQKKDFIKPLLYSFEAQ